MDVNSSESVVAICVGIIIVILSLHLLHHLFIEKENIPLLLKILCCIFCLSYIPSTICNWFSYIVDRSDRWLYNLLFNAFYDVINCTLYCIIIYRYHETFKSSQYKGSKRLYIFIFTLIAIYFISYAIWIVIYSINYNYKDYSTLTFVILFGSEVILLLIDSILTIIITFLFCRNLVLLTVSITANNEMYNRQKRKTSTKKHGHHKRKGKKQKNERIELVEPSQSGTTSSTITTTTTTTTTLHVSSKSRSRISTDKTSLLSSDSNSDLYYVEEEYLKHELNEQQERLLSLTVRLIILTVPAMLSTSIVWIVSLIGWTFQYYQGSDNIYYVAIIWILHVMIIPFDSICNFLCVYLAFDFVQEYYNFLCCFLHNCCYNMFKRIITKRIIKFISSLPS